MKNSLLLLALCALCGFQNLNAQQNVGIGTTAPNASAALDIVATNKGLLIPRMTEAQRNAIASPANGLLVYQTTAPKGFYYCEGGVWTQIGAGGGGGGNWDLVGDDIHNSNAGDVGIGTATPDASAALDVVSTTKGVLIPRMTMAQRQAMTNAVVGLLIYQTDNNPGFYYCNSNPAPGMFSFTRIDAGIGQLPPQQWLGNGPVIYNAYGSAAAAQVGIGNPAPNASAILDVASTTKGMLIPRMTQAQRDAIATPATGLLVYQTDGAAGFYYWDGAAFSQIGAGSWTASGNNISNSNSGNVGIGTATPGAKLEVNGATRTQAVDVRNSNTNVGYLSGNPSGNFEINSASALNGGTPGHLILNPDYAGLIEGNVGIGFGSAASPTKGKFVVSSNSAAGTTNGIFGSGQAGISLQQKYPTIGFNQYRDMADSNTPKFMSAGYAMLQYLNPNGTIGFEALGTGAANANCPATGTQVFSITQNSEVGIGTHAPQANLDVRSPGDAAMQIVGPSPYIGFNRISNNAQIGFIRMWGDTPSPSWNRNGLEIGTPPGASRALMFSTNYERRMHIEHNGQVVIGSGNAASGYLLNVRGKAICEELRVLLTASWPDYVFKPGYKLRPLAEVEKHIAENGHLPGIAPAAEIEKNGLDLGAMQTKAMEKIEELTLYLIQLKKENDDLRARMEALENRH